MDAATWSVIISGAVGLGGLTSPLWLDWRATKQRRLEARDARLDELRSVVDDAAVVIMTVIDATLDLDPTVLDGDPVGGK